MAGEGRDRDAVHRTGKSLENGYSESFNGKLRDECLNGEIFYSLKEAQIVIENWRVEYNTKRPHSALRYRPPAPAACSPWRVNPTSQPNGRPCPAERRRPRNRRSGPATRHPQSTPRYVATPKETPPPRPRPTPPAPIIRVAPARGRAFFRKSSASETWHRLQSVLSRFFPAACRILRFPGRGS